MAFFTDRLGKLLLISAAVITAVTLTSMVLAPPEPETDASLLSPLTPVRIPARPGLALQLRGVDWAAADRFSMVIQTDRNCSACAVGEDYYAKLGAELNVAGEIQVIGISNQSIGVTDQWFRSMGVVADHVLQERDPFQQGFSIYPTVLIVDTTGIVTNAWFGKLSFEEEQELLAGIRGKSIDDSRSASPDAHFANEVSEENMPSLLRGIDSIVLDPRTRSDYRNGHRPGAINIPADEWESRLLNELDASKTFIVDCTDLHLFACRVSGFQLKDRFRIAMVHLLVP